MDISANCRRYSPLHLILLAIGNFCYKCCGYMIMLILFTCCNRQAQAERNTEENRADTIPFVLTNSAECSDSLTLSQLADSVFYINLHYKAFRQMINVQYFDSIIFVHDINGIFAFDGSGKLLYRKDIPFSCFDVNTVNKRFYTYSLSTNEVKVYDWDGKEVENIQLLADQNSFYGNYFLAINDSLFVRATYNTGNVEHELQFFNRKGRVVGKRKNYELFARSPNAHTYNEIWNRPLYRTPQGIRYHRCYDDTSFAIGADRILHPILVEQKIKKIPQNKRMEIMGGNESEYLKLCNKERLAGTRIYENSRFFLIEYLIGKSNWSLPNFLLYDRKNKALNRIENNLNEGFDSYNFHFGIFNDYDGGLGFAPLCQSGDFLIMVNAGNVQSASASIHPKTLYRNGRNINGSLYKCRSDVFGRIENRKRLESFLQHFNEEESTMLTIVKLKQ